ncbi:MAG: AAA family ATPase [Ilumatobacteraceae bacterium]
MEPLLIVTGPPGAGKSTVAELVAARLPAPTVLVEGDAFFAFLRAGAIDPWLPAAHPQNEAVTAAAGATTGRFAASFNTVYDGVLGPWFLDEFLAAAGLAEADYAVIVPPVDVCVRRVAERRNHGFTDEPATRHMHEQFRVAATDPRHVVDDPTTDASAVADLILAARAEGRLRWRVQ